MGRGKSTQSKALIAACQEILTEIQPASGRAVCYQLFIRRLIPDMSKGCTNAVGTQLVYARRQGLVPWEWIVDETRDAERPGTWADPARFIPTALAAYRRDRWAHQSTWVEVWSEKGTVRGTPAPILRTYGVTFRVMHGYTSWTCLKDVADECLYSVKPLIVVYVGDYDPSGMGMSTDDLPKRLAELGARPTIQRLAIDRTFATNAALPAFAADEKRHDPRYAWFVAQYGAQCWELDAMAPPALRAVVEAAEKRSLEQVLGTWHAVLTGER